MKLLVVEDEAVMAEAIAAGLRTAGHVVDVAADGAEAIGKAQNAAQLSAGYDVILLDRDLPVVHGDQVCRQLVAADNPARIIMLTAAAEVDDRVAGLDLGADDYLPKPFAFRELLARVDALGRRAPQTEAEVTHLGDLTVDRTRFEVRRAGREIALTPKEFGVLYELVRAAGAPVSAEHLLERVWDENADPFSGAVKVTITRLRAKLGSPDIIRNERGVGYRAVAR